MPARSVASRRTLEWRGGKWRESPTNHGQCTRLRVLRPRGTRRDRDGTLARRCRTWLGRPCGTRGDGDRLRLVVAHAGSFSPDAFEWLPFRESSSLKLEADARRAIWVLGGATDGRTIAGGGVESRRRDPSWRARPVNREFDPRSSLTRGARTVSPCGAPCSWHGHVALRPIGEAWCSARTRRDGSWIPCFQEQRHRPSSTSGRRANDQEPCRPAGRGSGVSRRPGKTSATRGRPADGRGDSSGFGACGLRTARPDDVLLSVPAAAGRRACQPAPIAERS